MTVAHPSDSRERAIVLYKRRKRELDKLEAEALASRERYNKITSQMIPPLKNAVDAQLRNLGRALDREIQEEDKACSS